MTPHPYCTGSCTDGRPCDCMPDVEDLDPPREPMTAGQALTLIGLLMVSGLSAIALIGFAAGWVAGKL